MPLYISTKVYLKSPHSLTDLLPCLRLALFETGATYSKRIYIWSHTGLFSQSLFFFFWFVIRGNLPSLLQTFVWLFHSHLLLLLYHLSCPLPLQENWTWCSEVMTHLSFPPPSRAASSSSELHKTMCCYLCACVCLCVCGCVTQGDRQGGKQMDWQTGRLLVDFQDSPNIAFLWLHCVLASLKKKERKKKKWEGVSLLLSESVCCLSMWRESHVPCRAFQACLLTWWLPWEQPDSGRLCTSLLGGIVRTERRFKSEESLRVFKKKKKLRGKTSKLFVFFDA